jgi:hypothetical protein
MGQYAAVIDPGGRPQAAERLSAGGIREAQFKRCRFAVHQPAGFSADSQLQSYALLFSDQWGAGESGCYPENVQQEGREQ